jgi:hypothetical protein
MSFQPSRRFFTQASLSAIASMACLAAAPDLATPAGPTVLQVTGNISRTNDAGMARFDLPMLESLGLSGFRTTMPWSREWTRFDGVRMDRLMAAVGAEGEIVLAYAANDYSTELRVADFSRFDVLLALLRNGTYLPSRAEAPLFVVYPADGGGSRPGTRTSCSSACPVVRLHVT